MDEKDKIIEGLKWQLELAIQDSQAAKHELDDLAIKYEAEKQKSYDYYMDIQDIKDIEHGTIIRLKSSNTYLVCLHYSKIDMEGRQKHNKHNKNHTGFYLFRGLWYEGDPLTEIPYGKDYGRLERGMFPNIEIVGHIKTHRHLIN